MIAALFALGLLSADAATATTAGTASTSMSHRQEACITCHSDSDTFDEPELSIPKRFLEDVHREAGLSCVDCHGGNADPKLWDDEDAAMNESYAKSPFRGAPSRKDIPAFCGRCHSDAVYMKRFRPDLRVDQEQEYRTSRHGIALAKGDTEVAVCTDCHGVHGMLDPADRRSPVYPTNVAETCKRCHADAKKMAGRKTDDGRPLPIDQYAKWRESVHAKAMFDREDLSAPTCNDCHGNHGAAPPGLGSVAFVCGRCHGREADLFRGSDKHQGMIAVGRGDEQCTACHSNHGIVRPTIAMLSPLPATPCAFCHEGPFPVGEGDNPEVKKHFEQVRDTLLKEADAAGLSGDDRFDRLVDDAQALPFHTTDDGHLRPEFERLFTKFRIGKTWYSYPDPVTGEPVHATVVRCQSCHDAGTAGAKVAGELLSRMWEITGRTARAQRILLAARRGGVETAPALPDVDAAVDAQIDLEVLVHGFSVAPDGAFRKAQETGTAAAERAETKGHAMFAELAYRRRGLGVSLGLIAMLLVALALKIRSLPPA